MIISYILFTSSIKEYILVLLFIILFIVLCLKDRYIIFDYLYKNLIYLYGFGLSFYSLSTKIIYYLLIL